MVNVGSIPIMVAIVTIFNSNHLENSHIMGLIRYRSFHVTYIPATNHRPSRIKIRDCWYKENLVILMNPENKNILETAQEVLELIGFNIVAKAASDRGDLLLCENFELRLK